MDTALTTINNNVSVMVHTPPPGTTAISIRRAISNTPDIVDKLGSIERSVFMASTAKVAQEYNESELAIVMADTLKWIARDIGIRDTDSPEWKITIVRVSQIFRRYYPLFSVKDVKMAFELTITGELNDYFPKDRFGNPDKEHYQMFNADYFCKVINAYMVYRQAVIKKVVSMVPKPVIERKKNECSTYKEATRKDVIQSYLFYKYHGRLPDMSPIMELLIYNVLSKVNLVEEIEVTEQEQQIILRRTLFEMAQKQMLGDKQRIEKQGVAAREIKYPAFTLARKKAIKKAFDEMVKLEIQITDYI